MVMHIGVAPAVILPNSSLCLLIFIACKKNPVFNEAVITCAKYLRALGQDTPIS